MARPTVAVPRASRAPDHGLVRGAALRRVGWRLAAFGPSALHERVGEWLEIRECRRLLAQARAGPGAGYLPTDGEEPLVSVCIPTLVRDRQLLFRALRAALAQTHPNIEVVVVSDGDAAVLESVVTELADPRLRAVTVAPIPSTRARRGIYGRHPSGCAKRNIALTLARGAWIAPSDDDDVMEPDHVESLLRAAREQHAELVFSQARKERAPGEWVTIGRLPLARGDIVQGAVLYSAALRFIPYRPTCWKIMEWDDWNLFRRMLRIGVRIGFLEQVTYTHHLEAPQRAGLTNPRAGGTAPV